ncbi:phage major tail tube protein [Marinomonas gallaica]|uniref:phage major tail tube protein n=1 Tax=Marinomonas gallaica TaxID=1806667 RepID=UPI003CE58767
MSIDILKNFMLTADGFGEVGLIDEYTPPSLEILTESIRGGGMDSEDAVDMGMAPMEVTFKMNGYHLDILKMWGLGEGTTKPLTARGWLQDEDGTNTALVHNMTARILKVEQDTWKAGEKSGVVITARLRFFKATHGSTVIHEIDVKGATRIIGGVDQLTGMRTTLGL